MGDPKKQRKKFKGPKVPWESSRLEEEKKIFLEYGLVNKKEIRKAESEWRRIAAQAKRLIRFRIKKDAQAEKEESLLMLRLQKMGLIHGEAQLEDILSLNVKDFLERRLQTQVFNLNLSLTIKQARQFITHGHILVNNRIINVPGYIVNVDDVISYGVNSNLNDPGHPERLKRKKEKVKEEKELSEEERLKQELEKIEKEVVVDTGVKE